MWLMYLFMLLFIFVSLILILIVLIQKGRGGGLATAFGGGGGSAAFGAKTGDVLTWATSIIFGIFLLLAIAMNLLMNIRQADEGGQAAGQADVMVIDPTSPIERDQPELPPQPEQP